jgi:hypothetical protein
MLVNVQAKYIHLQHQSQLHQILILIILITNNQLHMLQVKAQIHNLLHIIQHQVIQVVHLHQQLIMQHLHLLSEHILELIALNHKLQQIMVHILMVELVPVVELILLDQIQVQILA